MKKENLFNLVRIGVSISLMGFLIWTMRHSLRDILFEIRKTDKFFLLLSFLITILGFSFMGLRFRSVIKAQELRLSIVDSVVLTFIGFFFNIFLPTVIGGDLIKAYYVSKHSPNKLSAFACVAVDRFIGSLTLIGLAGISLLFVKKNLVTKPIILFFSMSVLLVAFIAVLIFSRRVARGLQWLFDFFKRLRLQDKISQIYEIMNNYKKYPKHLFNAIALSVILQIISFVGVFFLIKSLGFYVPMALVFVLMPLIGIASMAPSINGLGVREGSFVVLFMSSIGKDGAFALSMLYLAMYISISLFGGILYALGGHNRISLIDLRKANIEAKTIDCSER